MFRTLEHALQADRKILNFIIVLFRAKLIQCHELIPTYSLSFRLVNTVKIEKQTARKSSLNEKEKKCNLVFLIKLICLHTLFWYSLIAHKETKNMPTIIKIRYCFFSLLLIMLTFLVGIRWNHAAPNQ